jgi:hypothetical protein
MPLHQRQIIREAVVAAIIAANTSAGARVYETRAVPWARVQLPAISVYLPGDTVTEESKNTAPRVLDRVGQLEVIAAVETGENVDDAMDAIALEIERAMHKDPSFGGVCGGSVLSSTDSDTVEVGQKPLGFIVLTYEVDFNTGAPEADDTTLDDLNTVDSKIDLGNVQPDADQAEDTLQNLGA